MEHDAESVYVTQLIEGKNSVPRPLARRNLLRLYTLSPNSRYSIFVGFVFLALEVLIIFMGPHQVREADRTAAIGAMVVSGLFILVAFTFPLLSVRRISQAIRYGIGTMGRVERVQAARTGAYSTPAGMRNGAIEAMVSYSVNGQQHTSKVLLDRPWIRSVEVGSQLRLLIDPNKPSMLYVVDIAAHK
jgi:hypothetical protein